MSWRRAGFISERLVGVLIPLCVYVLLATLVLHLIDLRSIFFAGGEAKLRQATLAFAGGIVLYERLIYFEGLALAKPYGYALGGAMTLFALYYAGTFFAPGLPMVVAFILTEALFALLWWAGHHVSAACSVNDDKVNEEAAESGILHAVRLRLKPPKPAAPAKGKSSDRWAEKLRSRHPGRVLLYFTLVAMPLFGLGLCLFPSDHPARVRMGLLIFFYLWCALALLFLSSLRQLAVYFRRREVSLPDLVGLTWLALGFLGVTLTLVAAFLLPQPPSMQSLLMRAQIANAARELQTRYGARPSGANTQEEDANDPRKVGWSKDNINRFNQRYSQTDRLKDPGLSHYSRNSGWEPEARQVVALSAAVNDSFSKIFHILLKGIVGLALVSAVIIVLGTIYLTFQRLRQGTAGLASRAAKLVPRLNRGKKPAIPRGRRFITYGDPFADPALRADPNTLIRYLWQALLAWCADAGSPCPENQTPLEFVDGNPPPLKGFETSARFIARTFTFSEFSGQTVPEAVQAQLRQFWHDLKRHAATQ